MTQLKPPVGCLGMSSTVAEHLPSMSETPRSILSAGKHILSPDCIPSPVLAVMSFSAEDSEYKFWNRLFAFSLGSYLTSVLNFLICNMKNSTYLTERLKVNNK